LVAVPPAKDGKPEQRIHGQKEESSMNALPMSGLLGVFVVSAIVTWFAGVALAKATDSLDHRLNIGDAIGGLVLLGIAGSLPEIAVVITAALNNHIPVILGTLIGGLSIQTLLVVIFDAVASRERPIAYIAGTINLALETLFAVSITVLAIVGVFVPASATVLNVSPLSIAMLVAWVVGLFLINKARKIKKFNQVAHDASPGRKHHERRAVHPKVSYAKKPTYYVVGIFLFASAVTLVAGWALEETGNGLAGKLGIGTGIFAATAIALATSLPEISTGLESILIGDIHLAISDIIGGNAFMLVLFLLADLVARKPVLSFAKPADLTFAVLGAVMMVVYVVSFLVRPKKCYLRLGLDSVFVAVLYIAGAIVIQRMG
jgi:cation:H+ antiporter